MSGDSPRHGSRAGAHVGRPTRRLVVLGGVAAALASVAGCGLRLDLPQPPPPVPTRKPAPDERFLLDVIADLRALVQAASGLERAEVDGDVRRLVRETVSVQRRQVAVLTGRLTNAGVPAAEIEAATAPKPPPTTASGSRTPTLTPTQGAVGPAPCSADHRATPSVTTPPAVADIRTVDDLATALAAVGPDRWLALAAATQGTRDVVLSAWSSRLASAVLLGATVDPAPTPSAARPRIIEQTSPLVYGFEVVAAQSAGARRTRARETLDELRRLDLAVSTATTSAPGGWALPFPVTTPGAAQRLATHLLRTAVDATVEVAGPAPDGPALEDAARWSGRVQALAVDWGMRLDPFPGTAP